MTVVWQGAPLNMTNEPILIRRGGVQLRPQTKIKGTPRVILTPQFYHRVILSAVEGSQKTKNSRLNAESFLFGFRFADYSAVTT